MKKRSWEAHSAESFFGRKRHRHDDGTEVKDKDNDNDKVKFKDKDKDNVEVHAIVEGGRQKFSASEDILDFDIPGQENLIDTIRNGRLKRARNENENDLIDNDLVQELKKFKINDEVINNNNNNCQTLCIYNNEDLKKWTEEFLSSKFELKREINLIKEYQSTGRGRSSSTSVIHPFRSMNDLFFSSNQNSNFGSEPPKIIIEENNNNSQQTFFKSLQETFTEED